MKKFVLTVLIVPFVACSSDKVSEKNSELIMIENLEGVWLAIEEKIDHGTYPRLFEPIAEENQFKYIFSDDLSVKDSSIECIGEYELNEQSHILELNYNCIADEIIWKISSLTSEEMILESQISVELYIIKFKRQNQ